MTSTWRMTRLPRLNPGEHVPATAASEVPDPTLLHDIPIAAAIDGRSAGNHYRPF
jgi:hypothetical protein